MLNAYSNKNDLCLKYWLIQATNDARKVHMHLYDVVIETTQQHFVICLLHSVAHTEIHFKIFNEICYLKILGKN